jgi:hypothetical protein
VGLPWPRLANGRPGRKAHPGLESLQTGPVSNVLKIRPINKRAQLRRELAQLLV